MVIKVTLDRLLNFRQQQASVAARSSLCWVSNFVEPQTLKSESDFSFIVSRLSGKCDIQPLPGSCATAMSCCRCDDVIFTRS